jgi:hypothetical protein
MQIHAWPLTTINGSPPLLELLRSSPAFWKVGAGAGGYVLPCKHPNTPIGSLYLNNVITPLYELCRDQGYKIIDGKYTRRKKDHMQVIGHNDWKKFF